MNPVLFLHDRLASAIPIYFLVIGLWGLVGFFRRSSPGGSYLGTLVVGEVLVLGQALVGLVLVFIGPPPRDLTHFLYGITAFLAIPLAYRYGQERSGPTQSLFYGLATLFIFGLGLRAIATGLGRLIFPVP